MKDSLWYAHVVVKTLKLVISSCCFDEYGREMYKNACPTCSTNVFSSFKVMLHVPIFNADF